MPRISHFFGISIYMYFDDHAPPHFHARYAGDEAVVRIDDLSVGAGSLPPRALGMVLEWAAQHRRELAGDWALAELGETLEQIEPLA